MKLPLNNLSNVNLTRRDFYAYKRFVRFYILMFQKNKDYFLFYQSFKKQFNLPKYWSRPSNQLLLDRFIQQAMRHGRRDKVSKIMSKTLHFLTKAAYNSIFPKCFQDIWVSDLIFKEVKFEFLEKLVRATMPLFKIKAPLLARKNLRKILRFKDLTVLQRVEPLYIWQRQSTAIKWIIRCSQIKNKSFFLTFTTLCWTILKGDQTNLVALKRKKAHLRAFSKKYLWGRKKKKLIDLLSYNTFTGSVIKAEATKFL